MSWIKIRDTLGLTLRPIDHWPGKRLHGRDQGPFKASLADTLDVLRRELRELGAKNIVLQIDLREKDFRQDGLPRADARPSDVGVILAFDTPKGPRRKAFDKFHNYEQNLRALAKNLENLRHANMYGVESDGGQYAGWKALAAPPSGPIGPFKDKNDAAIWLKDKGGYPGPSDHLLTDELARNRCYREATRLLHPDTPEGSHEMFLKLQVAMDMVRGTK